MELTAVDLVAFVAFMGLVVGVSLYAGRRERSSEGYFLAGRSLGWGLIGFSLIASNISTETLNLDLRQTGVGGDDSWGARPHPEYTLAPEPYRYSFTLRPVAAASQ